MFGVFSGLFGIASLVTIFFLVTLNMQYLGISFVITLVFMVLMLLSMYISEIIEASTSGVGSSFNSNPYDFGTKEWYQYENEQDKYFDKHGHY